jgi:hypothetical protein
VEEYAGVGTVHCAVKNFEPVEKTPEPVSAWQKLKFLMMIDRYMVSRLIGKAKPEFRNLPS